MQWPARITAEWCVILAALWLAHAWPNPLVWWLCALVIGTRQHALAVIGHWAAHRTMPGHQALMWASFAPIGMSPVKFKANHWAHHADVGGPTDPEAEIVARYADRWRRPRLRDSALDALGLHADEALELIRLTTTPASLAAMFVALAAALATVGLVALLWPAGTFTGLMFAHRLRARTEHDHLGRPGHSITTARPGLLARVVYLPHHTWLHAKHHANPGAVVWA